MRLFRNIILLIILVTISSTVYSQRTKKIIIADNASYYPLTYLDENKQPKGICIDIWNLWSKRSGIEVEFQLSSWSYAVKKVIDGNADVVGSIQFSEDRANVFDFSAPYFNMESYIFYHNSIDNLNSIEDLVGFKIGIIQNTPVVEVLKNSYHNLILVTFPNYDSLLSACLKKEIKVFVANFASADLYLTKYSIKNNFNKSRNSISAVRLCAAVKKGNNNLLKDINDGFLKVSQTEIDLIKNSWLSSFKENYLPWNKIIIIISVTILLVTIILIWNYLLQRKVRKVSISLRDKEKKYHDLIELLPQGIFEMDQNGTLTFANKYLYDLFDYSSIDLERGLNAFDLIEIDDKNKTETIKSLSVQNRAGEGSEYIGIRRDGKKIPIIIYSSSIIEKNKIVGLRGVITDNYERKKYEELLKSSETKFRNLTETTSAAIFIHREGKLLYVNPAAEKLFEYSHQELSNKYIWDLVHSEYKEMFIGYNQKLISDEVSQESIEIKYINKSGHERWLEISTRLFEPELSKDILVTGYDITTRKDFEKKVRESEEKYRNLIDTISEWIWEIDKFGIITFSSKKSFNILGYEPDEILGKNAFDLIVKSNESDFFEKMNKIISDRKPIIHSEVELKHKDGRNIIIETNALPFFENGVFAGYRGIHRDITERKKMQNEVLNARKIESISILAGGISHDFLNILTIILGNITLLKMLIKTDKIEKIEDKLANIEQACNRAKTLTQQLLAFSKGGTPLKSISSIAKILKEPEIFLIKKADIKSEILFPDDLWDITMDQKQFIQILQSLISNAINAMPKGGRIIIMADNITVNEKITLPLKTGNYVKVSIQDEGLGIPEEMLPNIFDPYFSTKERGIQRGIGLSLAITFSIINKHNGHITVDSKVGLGTTFTFFLPASVQ